MWLKSLLVGRRRLAGQDLRQPVDVDLAELSLALVLQPGDELGAEDVELAVQEAALVRDLVLLGFELVDQVLELPISESGKVRKSFHRVPFVCNGRRIEAGAAKRFNLSLRFALRPEIPAPPAPRRRAHAARVPALRTTPRSHPRRRYGRAARPGRATPRPSRARRSP